MRCGSSSGGGSVKKLGHRPYYCCLYLNPKKVLTFPPDSGVSMPEHVRRGNSFWVRTAVLAYQIRYIKKERKKAENETVKKT